MGHPVSESADRGSSSGYDTAAEETIGALPASKHTYEPLSSSQPSRVALQNALDGQMKSEIQKQNSKNPYVPLPSRDTSALTSALNSPGDISPRHVERGVLQLSTSGDYHDAADFLLSIPLMDQSSLPFGLQMPKRTGADSHSRRNSLDRTMKSAPQAKLGGLSVESAAKLPDNSSTALRLAGRRRDRSSGLTTSTVSLRWLNSLEGFITGNPNGPSVSNAAKHKQIKESGRLFGSYPTQIPIGTDEDISEDQSWAAGPSDEKNLPDSTHRSQTPLPSSMTLGKAHIGDEFPRSGHMDIPLHRLEIKNNGQEDFGNEKDDQLSAVFEKPETVAERAVRKRMEAVFPEFGPHLVSALVMKNSDQNERNRPGRQQYRRAILPILRECYKHPVQINHDSIENSEASSRNSAVERAKASNDVGLRWYHRASSRTPNHSKPKWYHQDPIEKQSQRVNSVPATGIFGPHGITNARTSRVKPSARDNEFRITVNVADTFTRQKYLVKVCRALMAYGDPTHRLEQHMKMSAKVLEIEAQFFYVPGCMIMSFDDSSTHTTELKLVRTNQSIDLGKLKDVQAIYKLVLHDKICIEEATRRLDGIIKRDRKFGRWFLVIIYGVASASVGPFAFQASWLDVPIAFILGCILGFIHVVLAPKSDLHSNVIELSSVVVTSFMAKGIGSFGTDGLPLFCFPALAKSAISILLPGYVVLCASLEMQSRSMIAGSVRMVYALVYSLLIGICISVGAFLWSPVQPLLFPNQPEPTRCREPVDRHWSFLAVPIFAACASIINGAKWKQIPMMTFIALAGYAVSFVITEYSRFKQGAAQAIAAFTIGVIGNMYSRFFHGFAAAVMMPAIFVQVPNGLAAVQSLSFEPASSASFPSQTPPISHSTLVLEVGYGMLSNAISISVGLLLSGVVCYPRGKKRSGLFSF